MNFLALADEANPKSAAVWMLGSKNLMYFTEIEHQTRFFVSFSSMEKEKIVRWKTQSFSINAIQQFKIQHRHRQPKKLKRKRYFFWFVFIWVFKENEQDDEGKSNLVFIYMNLFKNN